MRFVGELKTKRNFVVPNTLRGFKTVTLLTTYVK